MKASTRTAVMMIVIMMLSPLSITTSHTVMAYDDPVDSTGSLSPSGTTSTKHTVRLHWGPARDNLVDSLEIVDGEPTGPLEAETIPGWKMDGWYDDDTFTIAWDETKPVLADTDVYAKYEKQPINPSPSPGPAPSTPAPVYSISDLDVVKVTIDGQQVQAPRDDSMLVGHDAVINLTGVPDGWLVARSTSGQVETIIVTSPDGKITASWRFVHTAKPSPSTSQPSEPIMPSFSSPATRNDPVEPEWHDTVKDSTITKAPSSVDNKINPRLLVLIMIAVIAVLTSIIAWAGYLKTRKAIELGDSKITGREGDRLMNDDRSKPDLVSTGSGVIAMDNDGLAKLVESTSKHMSSIDDATNSAKPAEQLTSAVTEEQDHTAG